MSTKINFAHLSDIHFSKDGNQDLMLVEEGNVFFRSALQDFNSQPELDFVFISGDALNNGHQQELADFKASLALLEKPVYIIPGNHDGHNLDDPAVFTQRYFAAQFNPQYAERPATGQAGYFSLRVKPGVQLIGLDTSIPGQTGGEVDEAQLAWLADTLSQHADKLIILGLHHPLHPLLPQDRVPGQWQDWFVCANGQAVQTLLDSHSAVQVVLCGHHHVSKAFWAGNQVHLAAPPLVSYPIAYRLISLEEKSAGWHISWTTQSIAPDIQDRARSALLNSQFAKAYSPDSVARFADQAKGFALEQQYSGLISGLRA